MSQELLDLLTKAIDIVRASMAEPEPVVQEPVVQEPVGFFVDKSKFPPEMGDVLDLLQSPDWPEATPSVLICDENSEFDKTERAMGIIDYFSLENKRVLDFGCGEGHLAATVKSGSVGYDIVRSGNLLWESQEEYLLTTDFDKVLRNAPYDTIILFDVLDHCKSPVETLTQVKSVCSPNTQVLVRCHSWMSRHGSHLYKKANKAWIHLFFSEDELAQMGLAIEQPLQKYYFPLGEQKKWFTEAGFNIVKENAIKSAVEQFFRNPKLASRLKGGHKDFPEFQMSQSFNDYTLTAKL